MYIVFKGFSVAVLATYWLLDLTNWDDMGRRRSRQDVQTFYKHMQYVYRFKGNFSGSLVRTLVSGYVQLGRHETPASQTGCTDIFIIYAICI